MVKLATGSYRGGYTIVTVAACFLGHCSLFCLIVFLWVRSGQVGRVLCSKAALNLPLALRQEAEIWHSRQEERQGPNLCPLSSARFEMVQTFGSRHLVSED